MARTYTSHKIYPGLLIYLQPKSPYWYARIRVGGTYVSRTTKETIKADAVREAVLIQEKFLKDPESRLAEHANTFAYWAERLIQKEKLEPPAPSGNLKWKDTQKILNRKKGPLEFFGSDDVRSIRRPRIEAYLGQIALNGKQPSKWTQQKHLVVLNKVFTTAGVDVKMPKLNARQSDRQPRGFFSINDYRKLRDGAKEHANKLEITARNGTKYVLSPDVHSFIVFMLGSMLRPTRNEIFSLRHGDITVRQDEQQPDYQYLEFVVNRKNKTMKVATLQTCWYALRDIRERNPDYKEDDYILLPEYTNRQTAVSIMSLMFRTLLEEIGLTTDEMGHKFTPYSLRHSAIVFNLNQEGADRSDIAKRADTSFEMIDKFYYPQVPQPEKLRQYQRIVIEEES